ncbi:MAG: conjugal transfer protein TraX [Treponema sp.]|jgi:hypothetical protein|nr:conjugal transfer protein TraX [Treponema sp.]
MTSTNSANGLTSARELSTVRGLSSDNLKIIALLAMTLFHAADILFPWWKRYLPDVSAALLLLFCMGVGMTAMPVMCFLAAEGACHTKNRKKYLLRVSLWAVPAHIAYALATGKPLNPFAAPFTMHTSVLWTISCGIGAFFALMHRTKLRVELMLLLLALGLYGDWGVCAAVAILCMALTRNNFKKQMLAMSLCFCIGLVYTYIRQGPVLAVVQSCFLFSIPVLKRYNGKLYNSNPLPRSAFYWYYPAHLLILASLRQIINCG